MKQIILFLCAAWCTFTAYAFEPAAKKADIGSQIEKVGYFNKIRSWLETKRAVKSAEESAEESAAYNAYIASRFANIDSVEEMLAPKEKANSPVTTSHACEHKRACSLPPIPEEQKHHDREISSPTEVRLSSSVYLKEGAAVIGESSGYDLARERRTRLTISYLKKGKEIREFLVFPKLLSSSKKSFTGHYENVHLPAGGSSSSSTTTFHVAEPTGCSGDK